MSFYITAAFLSDSPDTVSHIQALGLGMCCAEHQQGATRKSNNPAAPQGASFTDLVMDQSIQAISTEYLKCVRKDDTYRDRSCEEKPLFS